MFKIFIEMIWYLIFFAVLIFIYVQVDKQIKKFEDYLYKKLKIDYHYKDKIIDFIGMFLAICAILYSTIFGYGFYLVTEKIF